MICKFLQLLGILFFTCCTNVPPPKEPIFPVTLGDVVVKDLPIYIQSVGNVFSLTTVQIRPQVAGVVKEAYVKEGQYVKKGDPLYLIDPRPYQAVLDEAKATLLKDQAALEFAEIRLVRYADLVKKDFFAKINYEEFTTTAESAKAQVLSDIAAVELAKLNLDWCTPVSTLTGKVSQYNIYPGNLVTAYDPNFLIDIRQIDPIDIRFTVNQKDFVRVQEAERAGALKFDASLPHGEDHPREGLVYFVDNHIDLGTGTILLKGSLPNADELLWPGEFVRVRLLLKVIPNALLVPEEAVQMGQEGPFIYVFQPETSRVEYRKVIKGQTSDNFTQIEKGIKAGEKVVLKGQVNLRPGVKVSLVEETP